MTPEQRAKVSQLISCVFLPGSYQKRFVQDLHARLEDDTPLSEKQAAYLDKLHHMYRKQIGKKESEG